MLPLSDDNKQDYDLYNVYHLCATIICVGDIKIKDHYHMSGVYHAQHIQSVNLTSKRHNNPVFFQNFTIITVFSLITWYQIRI